MISVSITRFWFFLKLGGSLEFGSGEVLGSSGLTVYKSVNAYLSLSDACESAIILSLSIRFI